MTACRRSVSRLTRRQGQHRHVVGHVAPTSAVDHMQQRMVPEQSSDKAHTHIHTHARTQMQCIVVKRCGLLSCIPDTSVQPTFITRVALEAVQLYSIIRAAVQAVQLYSNEQCAHQ